MSLRRETLPGPDDEHAGALIRALLLGSFSLLATQGLWNALAGGTALAVWKQVLVALCAAAMATQLRREEILADLVLAGLAIALCLASVLAGESVGKAIYNIFFYVSWIPFYRFGTKHRLSGAAGLYAALAIAVSAAGLWVQLGTSYLDLLKEDDAGLRDLVGSDQRLAFVFGFSTGVMPVLAVFYGLAILAGAGPVLTITLLGCLAASVIPTGSLAALTMLAACAAMALATLDARGRGAVLVLAALLALALAAGRTERIDIQLARILTNDAGSDSNVGRLGLWFSAADLVAGSTYTEFVLGRGIGSTNDDLFGPARFVHGESSLFQALIEGGIVGLLLRLMPFVLLVRGALGHSRHSALLWLAAGEFVACAVAPIAGTFGVQCGLALIAGLVTHDATLPVGVDDAREGWPAGTDETISPDGRPVARSGA